MSNLLSMFQTDLHPSFSNASLQVRSTNESGLEELRPVFWLFYINSKESRETPDLVYSICCGGVLLVGLLSNTASLLLLVRDRASYPLSRINQIYSHLLLADFLALLGFLPLEIYWTVTRRSLAVCRTIKFFAFLVFYAACLHLIILAVDRYIAIFMPLKHLTNRYRRLLSTSLWLVWVFSCSVGLWQALVHNVGPHRLVTSYFLCGAQEGVAQSFFIPVTALFCLLPLLTTLLINISISVKLINRNRERRGGGCPACRIQGGGCPAHLNIRCLTRDKPDLSELMKMKSVRMTVVVASCFTLSQAPNCIMYTWGWARAGQTESVNPVFFELSKVCQYVYVCIIPLLHGSLIQRTKNTNAFRLSFSRQSDGLYQVKQ